MSENSKTPDTGKRRTILLAAGSVLVAAIIGWLVYTAVSAKREADELTSQNEQMLLEMAQQDLERDFNDLNSEFAEFENQRQIITDDSVKRQLNDRYEAARIQVERLQQELADSNRRSAAEIARLRNEIETLRALLRQYVAEIDRLKHENRELRAENEQMRRQNDHLTARVNETSRQNEVLTERMTLAEKLNVTGVSLTALNKKGKNERKVSKAKQLCITFSIPVNNSTPVGEKQIYARIVSPSGEVLGNGGVFDFEGARVPCTAEITVEYAGEEINGLKMYYDVNTPLIAGEYTVELFADNFRLTSRNFTLQ